MNREPEQTIEEMLVAFQHSLNDLSSPRDGEHGEDECDEDTEQGKLSEDDEPGWVVGTITQTVQQHLKRFSQKQMKIGKWTQPAW
jgi:hypothetical protein